VEEDFVQLDHIVAAVDRSEEGRSALEAALSLARHSGGQVTALTIEPPVLGIPAMGDRTNPFGLALRQEAAPDSGYRKAVRLGLPGVEIGRFAEEAGAGLVILGRKRRSTTQRLFLGDTADEAVRRSQLPCLSVRAGSDHEFTTVLVALDGSARGMAVLLPALDLCRCTGSRLRVLTVEPSRSGEAESQLLPSTRSARLAQSVDRIRLDDQGGTSWDLAGSMDDSPLVIRHGQIVEEILAEVTACSADVLVIGYHRGGPAGVIEAGSIARRVLHQAECSGLTVPL